MSGYDLFCKRVCADVNLVKRMGIYCEYEKHSGCVNSLHFNESGNLVASGSDDLQVVVYDWTKEKEVVKFLSNHSSNIFQTKFLPNSGDSHIVTSARDGQVRLAQLSSTGSCRSHKKLAQHKGPVHKISLFSDSPEELYSCGEDGNVFHIDLRLDKLASYVVSSFTVKHKSKKVGLNSVSSNPMNSVELCVVGRDPYVRIYDIRKVDTDNKEDNCMKRFRAEFVKSDYMHMTCAVYNHIGTEIVASYSNDDIYLFDTSHSNNASEIKRYTGHRNSATVKGVNFYGPECQYVVSGSDCSNVFIWDKQSTEVVNVMHGDDQGVVNVVEPHKHLPMLATSGLDNKVKLWMAHKKPQSLMANLPAIMKKNAKNRKSDREASLFDDGHLLWFLMQTLRRSHRESDDSSADSSDMMPPPDDDDDDDDDDNDVDEGGPYSRDVQCAAS
ncbi:hypothetical protein HELRODRAFT_110145 [Helobdella robusta]|uniref:Uncharacterized protein n=1 Tax=Helobdella robusta TaxID=6412 RepID=T1EEZ8_HELRO|nr:hypothetical protein HELRODRAFT_110145 [Helobdella robusta]ESO08593.1 hypothetical protein HELRODRAFT_110145 [Helobdella robusta]